MSQRETESDCESESDRETGRDKETDVKNVYDCQTADCLFSSIVTISLFYEVCMVLSNSTSFVCLLLFVQGDAQPVCFFLLMISGVNPRLYLGPNYGITERHRERERERQSEKERERGGGECKSQ